MNAPPLMYAGFIVVWLWSTKLDRQWKWLGTVAVAILWNKRIAELVNFFLASFDQKFGKPGA